VHEVAYASLARADRRTKHLAAARYLEALGDEETSGILANHYLSAYQASKAGEEADALAAQARISLQAAAERAAALHSHRQAIGYLEQAISVTSDPAEQAAMHLRATESGENLFELDNAIEHAREARDLYRGLGDLPGVLRAATWMGRHHTSSKQEPLAVAIFEETLAEGADLADSAEFAALLAELSRVYMMTGRQAESVTTADRSLELGGRHQLVRPVVEALINKGTSLMNLGRMTEAAAMLRGAAAEADRHGLVSGSLRARNNLLGVLAGDNLSEAQALLREGYELALRSGNISFVQQFLMIMAADALRIGEWGAWMSEIAVIEDGETVHPFYQAGFAVDRATLAALRGDRDGAAAQVAIARAAAVQMDSQLVTAALEMTDAHVARAFGDWPTAARQGLAASKDSNFALEGADIAAQAAIAADLGPELSDAIAQLRTVQQTGRIAVAALAAAEAGQLARAGRPDEARAGYRRAITLRHEAGDLLEAAMTGLAWGLLAGAHDPEAASAQTEAEAFFAWRGGTPMVTAFKAAFVPVADSPQPVKAPAGESVSSGSPVARS
jgi:tetratricopeptide (TPR) repeat protein